MDDLPLICKARLLYQVLIAQRKLNEWPRYYRVLMIHHSPFVYAVRMKQIQFCIVNSMSAQMYINIITLCNTSCSMWLNEYWLDRISSDYQCALNRYRTNPDTCISYNIRKRCLTNAMQIPVVTTANEYRRVEPQLDEIDPIFWTGAEQYLWNLHLEPRREAAISFLYYPPCDRVVNPILLENGIPRIYNFQEELRLMQNESESE